MNVIVLMLFDESVQIHGKKCGYITALTKKNSRGEGLSCQCEMEKEDTLREKWKGIKSCIFFVFEKPDLNVKKFHHHQVSFLLQ